MIKEPTEEILEIIKTRKEAAEAEKEAEKIKIELDNKIKCFMGEAESIPGILTWKNNKDTEKVNWEEVALSFANEPNFNTIKEKYTETKTGARVLRIK